MDRFFDRLGDFLRVLVGSDSGTGSDFDPRDPDVRAALAELDEYLDSGLDARRWDFSEAGRGAHAAGTNRGTGADAGEHRQQQGHHRQQHGPGQAQRATAPESLRRDYANLEVPFSASLQEVRISYRRLMRKYHPDRFSADPEKLRLATEISMRLNESFQSIVRHERGRGAH